MVLYKTYLFCCNLLIWLVTMATKRQNLRKNIKNQLLGSCLGIKLKLCQIVSYNASTKTLYFIAVAQALWMLWQQVSIDLQWEKRKLRFIMPRHQKVAGYYVIPSEILSVRPSVSTHHHSCIGNSSYSFRPILLKLYRCFKDGLKICILFFQNPEIIFYHFFPIFNLDIFRALILQICIWSMYLVSATPPTVFGESF